MIQPSSKVLQVINSSIFFIRKFTKIFVIAHQNPRIPPEKIEMTNLTYPTCPKSQNTPYLSIQLSSISLCNVEIEEYVGKFGRKER